MPNGLDQKNRDKLNLLTEKTNEVIAVQETELVVNYDEALNEYHKQNKPHKIQFLGNVFEIPNSMPFAFGMFYMRNCIKKVNGKTIFAVPDDLLDEFLILMFGPKFVTLLTEGAVELEFVFSTLVPDIMDKWGYNIEKTDTLVKNG